MPASKINIRDIMSAINQLINCKTKLLHLTTLYTYTFLNTVLLLVQDF